MKTFTEDCRYEYPLTEDSWIIDAGAHIGNFSRAIGKLYNCNVLAFEPIKRFWNDAKQQNDKTRVFQCGVGGLTTWKQFRIKGDMSGEFADGTESEIVLILDIAEVLRMVPANVALLKLNIEGGEYEVLQRILDQELQRGIRNIQVQFHHVHQGDQSLISRDRIRERLARTHFTTYDEEWKWENWQLK